MRLYPLWPFVAAAVVAVAALATAAWRGRGGAHRRTDLRRLGMAILVLFIAVRPVFGNQAARAMASDVDVLLLIDRTTSMGAEDWNGTARREQGVAHDAAKIAERYPGARFAIITFTSEGYVEMPFSSDATAMIALADSINPELYIYSKGSSISAGVETARKLLDKAKAEKPGRTRHVIYMGDGEQTSKDAPGSFAALKPLISGGAVLGYGTTAGGKVPNGISKGYVHTAGGDAVSHIDEGNLRRIAGDLGVDYLHRERPDTPALKGADGGFASMLGDARVTAGIETYWVAALALLALVLWEMWDAATLHRRLRAELGVRKGTT